MDITIHADYISAKITINAKETEVFIEELLDIFEQLGISDYEIIQEYKCKPGVRQTLSEYKIYFGCEEDAMAFKLRWV